MGIVGAAVVLCSCGARSDRSESHGDGAPFNSTPPDETTTSPTDSSAGMMTPGTPEDPVLGNPVPVTPVAPPRATVEPSSPEDVLVDLTGQYYQPTVLSVSEQHVWWMNRNDERVHRISKVGGGEPEVVTAFPEVVEPRNDLGPLEGYEGYDPLELLVTSAFVYVRRTGGVLRNSHGLSSGTTRFELQFERRTVTDAALFGGTLHYALAGCSRVGRIDGDAALTSFERQGQTSGEAFLATLENGDVVCGEGIVILHFREGSPEPLLLATLEQPIGALCILGEYVYWIESLGRSPEPREPTTRKLRVKRMLLEGGAAEWVADGPEQSVFDFACDSEGRWFAWASRPVSREMGTTLHILRVGDSEVRVEPVHGLDLDVRDFDTDGETLYWVEPRFIMGRSID